MYLYFFVVFKTSMPTLCNYETQLLMSYVASALVGQLFLKKHRVWCISSIVWYGLHVSIKYATGLTLSF